MSVTQGYLDFVVDQLQGLGEVTARRMFGGAGLYLDGRMFGLIAEDELYLRVDAINRSRHEAAGCHAFRPFPDKAGRSAVMPYWTVPPVVLDDRDGLCEWARAALAAAIRKSRPGRKCGKAGAGSGGSS
ncbi:MAG: TfoX/Sxy family protein [Verrucomicrobiae bacterium]|nr:TfoX/Sxy family protein [Verrucomicrobiae bacterium]